MKNKQTYLSNEDRVLIASLVTKKIEEAMKEKLTPQSIKEIASMQTLVEKMEAKVS
jgi:hypothetical protein